MKNRFRLLLAFTLMTLPSVSSAAQKMSPDMKTADTFITKAFGPQCTRHQPDGPQPDGTWDKRYDIKYKYSYDAAGAPDNVFHLYRMHCDMGAYNETVVFLTRDEDGNFQILSFAQPTATYDYTDDKDTKLKHPPVLTGISSSTSLVNADFEPKTKTISSRGMWRGIGDAYDAATYEFIDGTFQLTKYVVDPIYEANIEGDGGKALENENYTLFPFSGK